MSLFCELPALSKELPDSIKGRWEIGEVYINTEASRTPLYAWNDPRLVGRIFTFTSNQISNDTPERLECVKPNVSATSAEPHQLIKKSLAGYGYPARDASIEDYRLDTGRKGKVEVIRVYCGGSLWNGGLGVEGGIRGLWFFFIDTNRVVLRWFDEAILVLDRIPNNQRPQPSFDCSKASTETENEICRSVELSAFDRRVALAYKLALSQHKGADDDASSLARGQNLWLASRNKCGNDKLAFSLR